MNNKQPNIIFITCDHMRADLLGCAGHETIQTPHIDELAQRGVRFTQAYSPTPICIPARASIMTGLEGHNLGLTEFKTGFELPVQDTLPRQLSDAGYQTMVVGKMHTFPERCHYGFDQMILCEEGRMFGEASDEKRGYDDYETWLAEQGYPGQAFSHGMGINDYAMTPWHLPDHLHPTEWIGYEATKQIKRRDWTRPLFLWLSFTAPHPPITPLMRDLYLYERDEMPMPKIGDWESEHALYHSPNMSRYQELMTDKQIDSTYRGFYASVTQIDRQINRMIGTLSEQGMMENTWFIFTSDHGDSLGDHYLWQKGNFLRGSTNIPMIITPPLGTENTKELGENWIPGTVNHSVVSLQDILPTCVDIGQGYIPEDIDGNSLIPLVKKPDERVRDHIVGEFGKKGNRTFMVTDGRWKYIWYEEDGTELLFHIEEDPDELKNLSQINEEQLQYLQNILVEKLEKRGEEEAVKHGKLNAISPGYTPTDTEKVQRLSKYFKLKTPRGLH